MLQLSSWFRLGHGEAGVHALASSASLDELSHQSTAKRALHAQDKCHSLLPVAPSTFNRAFPWVWPHRFSKLVDGWRTRYSACLIQIFGVSYIFQVTYLTRPTLWEEEWRWGCLPTWVCFPLGGGCPSSLKLATHRTKIKSAALSVSWVRPAVFFF